MNKKIFSDDPLIKYKGTSISAECTKHQIDGVLSEYEVQDIYWHWNQKLIDSGEPGEIYVMFKIEETIEGLPVKVGIRVDCPTIWDRAKPKRRPPRSEMVNWRVSLRAMHWFIYTHLNSAYAMQSSKTMAFLPYVQTGRGQQFKDMILPELKTYRALESTPEKESGFDRSNVIEAEIVEDNEIDEGIS